MQATVCADCLEQRPGSEVADLATERAIRLLVEAGMVAPDYRRKAS